MGWEKRGGMPSLVWETRDGHLQQETLYWILKETAGVTQVEKEDRERACGGKAEGNMF